MSSNDGACGQDVLHDVSVIGLGYIGLPTAVMFAGAGCSVAGVDISSRAVDSINAGEPHFEEAGLTELVAHCVRNGSLRAYLTPRPARSFIIAVPTPVDHTTHEPDISYVLAAGRSIAPVLTSGNLIVLESTSPVGTTRALAALLSELRPDLSFPLDGRETADIHLAYCPERIIPGRMLEELVENDRIIGGMTENCAAKASALYRKFVRGACIPSDDRTAELCKLTENSFRDVNIAFANELSMICSDVGIDVWRVIELANRHPRVKILNPGPGVGGHCIAVDPWFIVSGAPERARIIRTAREVNDSKPDYVLSQIAHAVQATGDANSKIACFGLTYKPDVDDFRESPALHIAEQLSMRYPGRIVCVDPFSDALAHSVEVATAITFSGAQDAVDSADVIVMLVGHSEFKSIPRPKGKTVVDAVGFWK